MCVCVCVRALLAIEFRRNTSMLKMKGWFEAWPSNERLEVTSLHLSRSTTKQSRIVAEKDVELKEALMLLSPASLSSSVENMILCGHFQPVGD